MEVTNVLKIQCTGAFKGLAFWAPTSRDAVKVCNAGPYFGGKSYPL